MPAPPVDRPLRWIIGTAVGLALVALLVWSFVDPYRGTVDMFNEPSRPLDAPLTRTQAIEDLHEVYATFSSRHVAALHGPPSAVTDAYHREVASLPEQPTVLDVWRAASAMVSPIKDGHMVVAPYDPDAVETTVGFTFDGATLRLEGGDIVTSVDGVSVADLWREFNRFSTAESAAAARYDFARFLQRPERLAWLGAPGGGEGVRVGTADGEQVLEVAPRSQGHQGLVAEYRFEGDVGVLTVHECVASEEYSQVLREFFTAVQQRGVTRIAVDLRTNPGGTNSVAREFVTWLDVPEYVTWAASVRVGPWLIVNKPSQEVNERVPEPYRGEVFVLTSPATFSSAVDFADLLQGNGLATVVGEAPANNPTSYGDILRFQLPHSGLAWVTTYKLFVRVDGDPDPTRQLEPDIEVPADQALAEVLKS
ncbi:MAG TPA: hypothetical protein GXZ45_03025 [Propionibacterium sp.]|nr:hypothetical protein [Propionibacterium sp.]